MQEEYKGLVDAVKTYVDYHDKHKRYEEEKTKAFQEAANLARQGKQVEARRIIQGYDNACRVFDYSKVHKGLAQAIREIGEKK